MRWRVLCELLEQPPESRWLHRGQEPVGWHIGRLWYVDPAGYRAATGTWPPGYWPEPNENAPTEVGALGNRTSRG